MTRAGVSIDELSPEVKQQVRKRLKPDKDSLTRAAVKVLDALDDTGLGVSQWCRVLDLVKKMLKV